MPLAFVTGTKSDTNFLPSKSGYSNRDCTQVLTHEKQEIYSLGSLRTCWAHVPPNASLPRLCLSCAATCYLWARHTPLVRTYPVSPCPWVGPYEGTVSMLVCCSCMLPSQHACALPCMLPCQHACALPMLPMRASSLCTLLRCPNHLLHLALLAFMGPRCCPREIP